MLLQKRRKLQLNQYTSYYVYGDPIRTWDWRETPGTASLEADEVEVELAGDVAVGGPTGNGVRQADVATGVLGLKRIA